MLLNGQIFQDCVPFIRPAITANLNAGHSGGDSVAIVYIYSPSSPTSISPSPILPMPNKPYGFCRL